MVRIGHHVLDDDRVSRVGVAQYHIGAERPNGYFRPFEFKVYAQRFAWGVKIVGEPRSKVTRFVLPDLTDGDRLEALNGGGHLMDFPF